MKPTRKDLIRVLTERELKRLTAELELAQAELRNMDHDVRGESCQAVRERCRKAFVAKNKLKPLLAHLDKCGLKYELSVNPDNKPDDYRCSLYIQSPQVACKIVNMPMTAAEQRRNSLNDAKINALRDKINALIHRKRTLEDSAGESVVAGLISELLVTNDADMQALIVAVETKLTAAVDKVLAD